MSGTSNIEHRTPNIELTRRQREVLAGIASGRSHKQVAAAMGIKYQTFCSYRKALYRRLGVRSEVEATRAAGRLGIGN